ncbi:lipase [Leucobacter chromiireducens]|uniref:Lipase n=1 Tax=Leucobacter chromiireducens subsp. solipictus TaxID=398235 RepID=A0ABS1SJ72_9MICO|nr:lipase [Leucobacter chromiireducens]MBL3679529.1 lipase [Leucobacter chromiireducens subsp. solipictus]
MKTIPVAIALVAGLLLPTGVAEAAHAAEPNLGIECLDIPLRQTLTTADASAPDVPLSTPTVALVEPDYDWRAAVEMAYAEVGTARPTGWAAPGECIESARRWVNAGGGGWDGGGSVLDNYAAASRHGVSEAVPGDVIQYHADGAEGAWAVGVHTVLVTGLNGDGTLRIVESNNPGGSGLVSADESWTPQPPVGFHAVAWRF